jgi:photosystem II stability/assembly factor-like uncharacterized protein
VRVDRRILWVVELVVLFGLTFLVGCGTNLSDPNAWITPGPSLPARPGAHVWVVGLTDVVVTSADGGASWALAHQGTMTSDSDSMGDLWGVAFGDTAHGWAVERGLGHPTKILATTDGGTTWTWQYPGPSGTLLAVAAVGSQRAWAVGRQAANVPLMLTTSDGGAAWKQKVLGLPHIELYDVAFADARHGWVLGATNPDPGGSWTYDVLATEDGGLHWRVSYKVNYFTKKVRLSRLACSGPRSCWVVGSREEKGGNQQPGLVLATTDGGAHWRMQPSVTPGPLSDVAFPDARHGWAVGPAGTIIATADGGRTWRAQHTDPRYDLKAVAFSDATHGWAIFSNVALLATGDGGVAWTVVKPTSMANYLAAITCLGPGMAK